MRTKLILILIVVSLLGGGFAIYFIGAGASKKAQVEQQFIKESREARRKAAQMLIPDAGNDLSFGRKRSTQEPESTPQDKPE